MKNKSLKIFFVFVLLLVIIPMGVNAKTIKVGGATGNSNKIKFASNGITAKNCKHDFTYKKWIVNNDGTKGDSVYCVVSDATFKVNLTYKTCSPRTNETLKNRITAGQVVDIVNSKSGWSSDKKYAVKVAALNTIMQYGGRCRFSGSDLDDVLTEARTKYTTINNAIKNDGAAFRTGITYSSDGRMNAVKKKSGTYDNTKFVSNKVTITGLKTSYLGATPTYKITAKNLASGQTVSLCKKDGSDCTEITSNGVDLPSNGSFWIMSTGVNAENLSSAVSFKIVLTAKVNISYSIGEIYYRNCMTDYQPVLVKKKEPREYSFSHYLNFKIKPVDDAHHNITIEKVDENGEYVAGATFAKSTASGQYSSTLEGPTSTDTGVFEFSYTIANNNDQFFGKKYCFVETKVPKGYVAGETEYCVTISENQKTEQCLDSDGNVANNGYCNEDIKWICKSVRTPAAEVTPQDPGTVDPGNEEPTNEEPQDPWGTPEAPVYTEYDQTTCVGSVTDGVEKIETEKVCGRLNNGTYTAENSDYCENAVNYQKVINDNGNITIRVQNNKNVLKISKQIATTKKDGSSDSEVDGAELKICTKAAYETDNKKEKCEAAKTVKNGDEPQVTMSWTSGTSPREFNGVLPGDYYLIETLPPAGYQITTATKFTVEEDGTVKDSSGAVAQDNTIIIGNKLNDLTISKTDIVTTKEVPGAQLSICEVVEQLEEREVDTLDDSDVDDEGGAGTPVSTEASDNETEAIVEVDGTKVKLKVDEFGDCIPARLANGEDATWTSGTEPKKISGLPSGTYYLVETTAPNGYSVSEAILFRMLDDGTLADKDGKSIANNKIVMKDEPLEDKKTGMLPIIIIALFGFVSLGALAYVYIFKNKKNNDDLNKQEL